MVHGELLTVDTIDFNDGHIMVVNGELEVGIAGDRNKTHAVAKRNEMSANGGLGQIEEHYKTFIVNLLGFHCRSLTLPIRIRQRKISLTLQELD